MPSDNDISSIMQTAILLHRPFLKLSELTYDEDDDGDSLNRGKGEDILDSGGYFEEVVDKLKKCKPYLPPNKLLQRIISSEIRLLPRFLSLWLQV